MPEKVPLLFMLVHFLSKKLLCFFPKTSHVDYDFSKHWKTYKCLQIHSNRINIARIVVVKLSCVQTYKFNLHNAA